jgi:hypothetical protein
MTGKPNANPITYAHSIEKLLLSNNGESISCSKNEVWKLRIWRTPRSQTLFFSHKALVIALYVLTKQSRITGTCTSSTKSDVARCLQRNTRVSILSILSLELKLRQVQESFISAPCIKLPESESKDDETGEESIQFIEAAETGHSGRGFYRSIRKLTYVR